MCRRQPFYLLCATKGELGKATKCNRATVEGSLLLLLLPCFKLSRCDYSLQSGHNSLWSTTFPAFSSKHSRALKYLQSPLYLCGLRWLQVGYKFVKHEQWGKKNVWLFFWRRLRGKEMEYIKWGGSARDGIIILSDPEQCKARSCGLQLLQRAFKSDMTKIWVPAVPVGSAAGS